MSRAPLKYNDEDMLEAVKSSVSIHQALLKLGIAAEGGNYRVFHRAKKRLGFDTSHFTGQVWSKGQVFGPKRPIEDYLSNKFSISSDALKKRLIREGLLQPVCNECALDTWLGKPIALELEHKDGDHENNTLANLRLLCPNCHAQTPTYRRRKELKQPKMEGLVGLTISKKKGNPHWRHLPKPEKRKIERPNLGVLLSDIENMGFRATGRKYGVSDNAIRKWIRFYQKN